MSGRMLTGPTRPTGLAGRIDAWLLAPCPRAAGNLGLLRILYSIFYLWMLSVLPPSLLSGEALPRQRMLILLPFPGDWSPLGFQILDTVLVTALVLLLIGWSVRAMTMIV